MEQIFAFLGMNWYWILIGLAVLIILVKFLPRYKIAPPDKALIISGLIRRNYKVRDADGSVSTKKFGYRIIRGGATFYVPAVERIDQLDLCLTQVDIRTAQPVPTKEYISVIVDAVANIKIGSDDLSIATAAEQLLHYNPEQIKALAKDVLEGNMREIIGQMTIAELVQNRDKFAQESIKAAMSDMSNMGLEIINLTIQNFIDKDGEVIDTMAARNIAEKEQDKRIAEAEAKKNYRFAELQSDAEIAREERETEVKKAAFKQETDEAKAKADVAYEVEKERIRKTLEAEKGAAEMTKREKLTEISRQEVEIAREKLNVDYREKAAAQRDADIAAADAEKYRLQAEADAALYAAQKEAEAIRMKGEAEAEAMRMKAEAMQLYGKAAMMQMVTEKLPDIARAVSEPLSKTEKIILFGEGGATSMARDTAGTMLQTFEAVKEAVGLDIPKTIRDVTTGGLIGKAAQEAADAPAEAPAAGEAEAPEADE